MRLTGVSAVSEGGQMSHKSVFIHFQRMFHIYIISNLNVHRDKILLDGKDAFTWQEKQNIVEARLEQSWAVIGWADQEVWPPFASSDSDAWLHDRLTCDNMAPKLELPNAAAIVWLIFLSLIRPVEATDVGNTLALVVITVVSMVGFCACLGWYARRRNGQLWGRLPACVPVARCCHPNTSLTVRNQPGLTYDPLWLIKNVPLWDKRWERSWIIEGGGGKRPGSPEHRNCCPAEKAPKVTACSRKTAFSRNAEYCW